MWSVATPHTWSAGSAHEQCAEKPTEKDDAGTQQLHRNAYPGVAIDIGTTHSEADRNTGPSHQPGEQNGRVSHPGPGLQPGIPSGKTSE